MHVLCTALHAAAMPPTLCVDAEHRCTVDMRCLWWATAAPRPPPPSNTLSFVTPAANAPLNTGSPKSPYVVVIKVVPPTLPPRNGGSW